MDKTSLGWGGDSNPAQQPQELQDRWEVSQAYHMPSKTQEFKWVIVGKKDIAVFSGDTVEPGYAALGVALDHHGAVAHGTVRVSHMWTAQFVVEQTNIDLDTLYKQFKKWANNPSINGDQLDHRFNLSDVFNKDGIPLPLGKEQGQPKTSADPGSGWQTVPKLWNRTDEGDLRTDIQKNYPGQDTMRSQQENLTDMPYQCAECGEVFDNYTDMLLHVSFDHPKEDPTGKEYEIRDNDEFFYPDNEMSRQNGEHGNSFGIVSKKSDVDIDGPMPFIYDIVADRIRVGEPGDESVDIGEYNAFGMVEGYYTPDQDLIIATQTSVPYTINHVKTLWNYMYPEYEVKHIYVVHVDDGKKIREKVSNA